MVHVSIQSLRAFRRAFPVACLSARLLLGSVRSGWARVGLDSVVFGCLPARLGYAVLG